MQGGYRKGAGRRIGSGKYGVATKVIRVPIHLEREVEEFIKMKIGKENDKSK